METGARMELSNTFGYIAGALVLGVFIIMGAIVAFAGLFGGVWESAAIGLVMFGVSLFILASKSLVIMSVDKAASRINARIWKITGSTSVSYPFSSVTKVKYTQWHAGKANTRRVLSFAFDNGREVPFEGVVGDEDEGREVADFIGVPFEDISDPSDADIARAMGEAIPAAKKEKEKAY